MEKRIIKFRGKRKDNGEWAYGYYIHRGFKDWIEVTMEGRATSDQYGISCGIVLQVDPETVGQYTGLHDKNGKDLDWWEDDLFDVLDTIRKIVFEDGCYWFKAVFPDKVVHRKLVCINIINGLDILPTKLGNIHDNPELLKGT